MTYKIFVDGQEGTTGLKIHDYLSKRDDVEILQIPSEKRKDVDARGDFINRSDVTFLCLPDTASMESSALVENEKTCVIDASTAFRTHGEWAYGLPELCPDQRKVIRNSKRITVPGCHATAFVLLVHPLVRSGIMQPDYPTTCFSVTGYSGGGKKLIETYETKHTPALGSPRHYALGMSHKHLPEMKVRSGLSETPVFCPVVGDFYKGLAVTVFLHPGRLAKRVGPRDIHGLLADYYQGERFIQVKPYGQDAENLDNGYFDVQACNDTNRADIFVFGNEERVVLITRLDNLGKGASGAAIQSMNVHLGIEETKGLV
jgi:N-acetyl-gamma-glutamyl-phosphate reductase